MSLKRAFVTNKAVFYLLFLTKFNNINSKVLAEAVPFRSPFHSSYVEEHGGARNAPKRADNRRRGTEYHDDESAAGRRGAGDVRWSP